ncbi:MAG: DUF547 domain-containing protein [Lentisphaerae bacterium]|jgi:hypothetical protein|nr:DUF547 domain-containing protein [Lentisphaerota bacterium]MBT4818278.1 DUF547 domain-containing protein [Lentisphaerota bacterium]MBT5605729.1 DUF547 domain-containing protein [Lentisphaerota bacterium]MBT7061959.1 DUF547 domain-containing protein [Lentisphaerota bacterium]MBT7842554.1 DUF547 domain-containing protein [Lentisphaerota bacterium]
MARDRKTYYGAFFWLSLAAFAVPIFVGVLAFQSLKGPHSKPTPTPDVSGVDNAVWDYLLKTYVEHGLVDYDGLERDHLFRTYLAQLGQATPKKLPSDNARLALLCNAYNAFVMAGVINHEIRDTVITYKSVDELGFFDLKEHIFAGETLSLNQVEHERIRPVFGEPRIHMALVCAAKSCPVIRAEAFTGEAIERQLEDQAVLFANTAVHISYDAPTKTLNLSAILKWYGDDFTPEGGFLAFLGERAEKNLLKDAIRAADAGTVTVAYNEYDWTLNTQASGKATPSRGGTGFGSGSVPNE